LIWPQLWRTRAKAAAESVRGMAQGGCHGSNRRCLGCDGAHRDPAAGLLAGLKNRDYSSWMGWSFLCPPLVLLLAVLPKLENRRPRRRALDDEDAAEA